jgi:DNA helicase-2/ATP-dependent DNA helicase PcrA
MTETLDPAVALRREGRPRFRRLAVYDVPSADLLLAQLKRLDPEARFELQPEWTLPNDHALSEQVPVWLWERSLDSLSAQSGELLRSFAYPLLVEEQPFCLAFPFGREELRPQALSVSSIGGLDLEDIGRLLARDVVEESLPLLAQLGERLALTPIELQLGRALEAAGIAVEPQAKVGPYRLDFLVTIGTRLVGVEADGRGFHDSRRDAERDQVLTRLGVERVLRFTGSQIFRDADGCAAQVAAALVRPPDVTRRVRRQSLDSSQQQAVEHSHGPARVLAPAGSGKTRVLVNRIVALVESGVDPAAILALAFNRKAYDQLVERLETLGIPVGARKLFDATAPGVVCATFNAFGYRYQREVLSLEHRLAQAPRLWRELMAEAMQVGGVSIKGAKRGSDPVGSFLEALELVRHDLAVPEEVGVELELLDGPQTVPFADAYRAFQQLRLDRGVQSFGDQLHVAVVDLLRNPPHRELLQDRFEHVLVDEYQDLNATQLALVEIVSRPWRNLFVVGDDDQLIYGWRFAKLASILEFHERMPPRPYSSTYTLSTNYRSSRAIVEASQRVIVNNQQREPKDMHAAPDAPEGEVRYVRSASRQERTDELVRFLREHERSGSRWSDLAVLCRYKAQQPFIALALERAEVPHTPLLTYRLFSDPQIELLRSYLQLVRDPRSLDGDTFRFLLNRPNRYLTNALVDAIAEAANPWARIELELSSSDCPSQLEALHARILALRAGFKAQQPSSSALLDDVLLSFGLEQYWQDARSKTRRESDDADTAVLLRLIRQHAEQNESPTQFLALWDENQVAERQRHEDATDKAGGESASAEDEVVIGTIHSSKGREFDAAVLYDYNCDLSRLAPEQLEEERRVFYVGLTRARHSALITSDAEKGELPRFVRESIAPSRPGEEAEIELELARLRADEKEFALAAGHLRERLEAIRSGAELQDVLARRELYSELVRQREAELASLTEFLERATLWNRLRRDTARARKQADGVREQLKRTKESRSELHDEAVLLRNEPELVAAPVQEELERTVERLEESRAAQRARLGRRQQLRLIEAT